VWHRAGEERTILNDGRPLRVGAREGRIGHGPWARWFASAVVPDEASSRAEKGRLLAQDGAVHTVTIALAEISAHVIGTTGREYVVRLAADPIPRQTWAAVRRSAQGRELIAAALARSPQSLRLEHVMVSDWEQPLVPRAWSIHRSCTCPDATGEAPTWVCKHVAALAYCIADAIDTDVTLLFRWRGCDPSGHDGPADAHSKVGTPEREAGQEGWLAGPLPELCARRPLPVAAVLKRLGPSGIVAGNQDLVEILAPAYRILAESATTDT
jgi:hypothetical protein